jgi:2-oxoglutarate dehydrogenase E1 component
MAQTATVEIQMPAMGESVTEGTVLEWHVSEGDQVSEGDTVVEVSTDKVDAEVPAPADGVITRILAQPDDEVKVGQTLAELSPGEDGASASATQADQTASDPAAPGGEAEEAAGSNSEEPTS